MNEIPDGHSLHRFPIHRVDQISHLHRILPRCTSTELPGRVRSTSRMKVKRNEEERRYHFGAMALTLKRPDGSDTTFIPIPISFTSTPGGTYKESIICSHRKRSSHQAENIDVLSQVFQVAQDESCSRVRSHLTVTCWLRILGVDCWRSLVLYRDRKHDCWLLQCPPLGVCWQTANHIKVKAEHVDNI